MSQHTFMEVFLLWLIPFSIDLGIVCYFYSITTTKSDPKTVKVETHEYTEPQ